MSGLYCPECHGKEFESQYAEDYFYVCKNCGKIVGYYCTGCGRMFTGNRLGLHGDVYECKLCGKIQWGYTGFKRRERQ